MGVIAAQTPEDAEKLAENGISSFAQESEFYLECFGIKGAVIIPGFLKHREGFGGNHFCKF